MESIPLSEKCGFPQHSEGICSSLGEWNTLHHYTNLSDVKMWFTCLAFYIRKPCILAKDSIFLSNSTAKFLLLRQGQDTNQLISQNMKKILLDQTKVIEFRILQSQHHLHTWLGNSPSDYSYNFKGQGFKTRRKGHGDYRLPFYCHLSTVICQMPMLT